MPVTENISLQSGSASTIPFLLFALVLVMVLFVSLKNFPKS